MTREQPRSFSLPILFTALNQLILPILLDTGVEKCRLRVIPIRCGDWAREQRALSSSEIHKGIRDEVVARLVPGSIEFVEEIGR